MKHIKSLQYTKLQSFIPFHSHLSDNRKISFSSYVWSSFHQNTTRQRIARVERQKHFLFQVSSSKTLPPTILFLETAARVGFRLLGQQQQISYNILRAAQGERGAARQHAKEITK